MLKWYASIFQLDENSMTPKGLKRVRVLYYLSLPVLPLWLCYVAVRLGLVSKEVASEPVFLIIFWAALVVSLISMMLLCFSRLVNRVWARDRYLDEWELRHKHASMAFAFQVLLHSLAGACLIAYIAHRYFDWNGPAQNLSFFIQNAAILVVAGFYLQVFYLIRNIRPMDTEPVMPSTYADPS